MPLTINGKVFLNLQEAVAWLLANNALPFQCKVNYVADTEIAKSNIINPSPAEIKIGSLVLFADGKVGTVSGITANGFMVGSESTDLSDGVPHITGIDLDASQHLVFTMSEGEPIDAGLVKGISSFTIDASQHLIANYNDGATQDLGAIFQGNISISGSLTVSGDANLFEKIVDSSGHKRFIEGSGTIFNPVTGMTITYNRWSLCGSHLMIVVAGTVEANTVIPAGNPLLFTYSLPQWIIDKIYPAISSYIDYKAVGFTNTGYSQVDTLTCILNKYSNYIAIQALSKTLANSDMSFRIQFDLLIDNN